MALDSHQTRLAPLPEHLQGQKERTVDEWLEVSAALNNTAAYAAFRKERVAQNLLAVRMVNLYLKSLRTYWGALAIRHPWFEDSIWDGFKLWADQITQLRRE